MNETEQALTEAVADVARGEMVQYAMRMGADLSRPPSITKEYAGRVATAAIAAVRAHDEQAALNCGHCDPNADEIACACQIEERDDE